VLWNSGFPIDGSRYARRAIDEADAADVMPPPDPYYALVWEARSAGRNEEAVALVRTGAELATNAANPWMGLVIRMQGCGALSYLDAAAGVAEAAELVALADQLEVPVFQAAAEFALGHALAFAGRRGDCELHLDRADELARGTVLHIPISTALLRGTLLADDDPAAAMRWLREAIDLGERHAVMPDILASAYEAVAAIWIAEDRMAAAAVLMGAVDHVRAAIGADQDPFGVDRREHVRSTLAAALSPTELDSFAARGRGLTHDELRRFVVGEYDPLPAVAERG